jgi:hypothetical protein
MLLFVCRGVAIAARSLAPAGLRRLAAIASIQWRHVTHAFLTRGVRRRQARFPPAAAFAVEASYISACCGGGVGGHRLEPA